MPTGDTGCSVSFSKKREKREGEGDVRRESPIREMPPSDQVLHELEKERDQGASLCGRDSA